VRGQWARGEKIDEKTREKIELLSSALSKSKLPRAELFRNITKGEIEAYFGKELLEKINDVVKRGKMKDLKNILKSIENQKVMGSDYFTSVSGWKNTPHEEDSQMQIVMDIPAGTQGLTLETISKYEPEKEVLLQKDNDLEITDVSFGQDSKGRNKFFIRVKVHPLYEL
jgi:hypothetical protein